MENTFLQHTEARTKLQPFPLVEARVWAEGAEAVWACYLEGKKSPWEAGLLVTENAAEQQRRNSLKPLALVSQEASWGEGIEKAAAEPMSLHFCFLFCSSWEKAADFRVWTKHKEPSTCRSGGGKCLPAKTTDLLITISLAITLGSDGGLGKGRDDSQKPIQQCLCCLCALLPTQVLTGQENLSKKMNLPHPKHGLLNILSTAIDRVWGKIKKTGQLTPTTFQPYWWQRTEKKLCSGKFSFKTGWFPDCYGGGIGQ